MNHQYLILLSLLFISFGGCTSGSETNDTADAPVNLHFRAPPPAPLIINKTTEEGGFWWRFEFDHECRWEPRDHIFYRLYGQEGLRESQVLTVDSTKDNESFWIPLVGEGPWLWAGADHPCEKAWYAGAYGIAEGYVPNLFPGNRTLADMQDAVMIPIQLEPGDTVAEAEWEGDQWVYKSLGGFPELVGPSRGFAATVTMHYPDGEPWRTDVYRLSGSHETDFEPMQFVPGAWTIRVEAERPVVAPVTIEYWVIYRALDEGYCAHGFGWHMCAEGDRGSDL